VIKSRGTYEDYFISLLRENCNACSMKYIRRFRQCDCRSCDVNNVPLIYHLIVGGG